MPALSDVDALHVGSTLVDAVYLGSELVWSAVALGDLSDPAEVALRPNGDSVITLEWNPSTEPQLSHYEYRVGLTNPPTGLPQIVPATKFSGTNFEREQVNIFGRTNGVTYYAQVRSVDNVGVVGRWSQVQRCRASKLRRVQVAIGFERANTIPTQVTVALESTPTTGNVMLCWVKQLTFTGNGSAIGGPQGGWTRLASTTNTSQGRGSIFSRIVDGDPASVIVDLAGPDAQWVVIVVEYAGQAADPVDLVSIVQNGGGGVTSGVPTQADEVIIGCYLGGYTPGAVYSTSSAGWAKWYGRWIANIFETYPAVASSHTITWQRPGGGTLAHTHSIGSIVSLRAAS